MKIVLVLPLLGHGGGQRFITEIANYWSGLNHNVSIISLRKGESFYKISDEVSVIELGYVEIECKGRIKRLRSRINTFFDLRKEISKIEPDFVLSILSSTNLLTILAAGKLRTRVYVNDVMSPFRKRSFIEKKSRKILYKKADGIIALTKIAKKMIFEETGNKNIVVIPNPVKEILVDNNVKKEKIILNIGRLHPDKGQKYFLKVCAKLNNPEWKFVILGEGSLRKSLEELAIELNISDRIFMPGAVNNIDEWLSKSSIFAFTSVSESWGIALTESMTAGLPAVSFDCDVGPREMIEDGKNGFLVPVENIDIFTSRIAQLINDEELRKKISINAKKDSDKYKIEKIGNEILEFCTKPA